MNDKTRESLSALTDNEADELEIRRILAQAHDDEVMEVWCRYHAVKASLNADEAQWAQVDLRAGISRVLDAEEEYGSESRDSQSAAAIPQERSQEGVVPHKPVSRRTWWLGGSAIAASVAFALVFSVQSLVGPQQDTDALVADQNTAVEQAVPEVADANTAAEEIQFSQEHEQRLNAYLLKHAGNAALNGSQSVVPYARLTSFEPIEEMETSEGGDLKPEPSSETTGE